MPQTRANGVVVPTNPDAFANLTTDLQTLADSINPVIKVSSQAQRDALPTSNPAIKVAGCAVARGDLPGVPIQVYDGTNWLTGGGAVTSYALPAPDTNWNTPQGGLFKLNLAAGFQLVMLDLYLQRTGTAPTFTMGTSLGSMFTGYIPAGWRPTVYSDIESIVIDNASPAPINTAIMRVGTDGTVQGMIGTGQGALTVQSSFAFHIKGSWTI